MVPDAVVMVVMVLVVVMVQSHGGDIGDDGDDGHSRGDGEVRGPDLGCFLQA